MSTTEDTSAIDEKKHEETTTSITSADFKNFIINYLLSIIFTIGITIFVIGTFGLYTTKVAQANILPDNIELAPYTVFDRIVKDEPIDINIMRPSFFSESKDTLSQKATFNSQEYLDSFNKSFLCSLKKNANDPKGGLSASASLFFSSVYDNIVAKNFLAINTIFYYLSYLPESAIMFIYGFFGIFLWIALYFFNVCISIFYHIISIPELFRKESSKMPDSYFIANPDIPVLWESNEDISFFSVKLLLFCFIWWWIGLISIFITPAFFTFYGLISPLFATYKVKSINKPMNIGDFIKNTFAYKQFFFIILATMSLFSNGITYLGSNSIVGIVLAIAFAYFMGFYTNEMPTSDDGFGKKIRQNIKQLSVNPVNLKHPELVEICKPIPIDDPKIENKIKAGEYRELTKPKEVGGENNVNPPAYENNVAPSAPLMAISDYNENNVAPPPSAPLMAISDYNENNINPPPSAPLMAISDYNENNINPPPSAPLMNNDIKQLTETVTAPEYISRFDDPDNQFPIQNGGKKGKGKGKGKTKKYNIRFV
jgi:hypothetical protein